MNIAVRLLTLSIQLRIVLSFTASPIRPFGAMRVAERRRVLYRLNNNNNDKNDNGGPIFFDDFGGDFVGDSNQGGTGRNDDDNHNHNKNKAPTALQERISQMQQSEIQTSARVAKNFRQGNWKVRGFSLSKDDPRHEEAADPIIVTKVVFVNDNGRNYGTRGGDERPSAVIVGRSDGSVCWVELGTEYWTKFESKLTLVEEDEDGSSEEDGTTTTNNSTSNVNAATPPMKVKVKSLLERQEQSSMLSLTGDDELSSDQSSWSSSSSSSSGTPPMMEVPFEVKYQLDAHAKGEAVSALLTSRNVEEGLQVMVTGSTNGSLALWYLPVSDDKKTVTPVRSLQCHRDEIVTLKAIALADDDDDDPYYFLDDDDEADEITPSILFSASKDGSIALWDLWTGDLVYTCQMIQEVEDTSMDRSISIACADTDGRNFLFCGLSTGEVLTYNMRDLIEIASRGDTSCPLPNGQFLAHDAKDGVSSLIYGGKGTMDRQRAGEPPSLRVVTGGKDGTVKQWELLLRRETPSSNRDEGEDEKPRISLEHWPRLSTQRLPKRAHVMKHPTGMSGPAVTALALVDATKLLSASEDGTVRAYSPIEGTEMFVMDGFTTRISSLCLGKDLLVTDGMSHFVCVHDFDVDDSEFEEGYELEW